MNNQYQLIKDVHPGDVGWTVKVTIAEKSPARTAKKSPKKYQNIILMDSEGSTVQATLYDHNIIAFQDELIQGKTYLISNALVKLTNLEYRSQSGDTQWTISGKTRIQQVDENNSALLLTAYNFIDFEDLENHMDTNTDISIIGMVIDTRPKRMIQTRSGNQCQVQDIILVNKRLETIILTMWENFVDNECNYICENLAKKPVIIAKHLKVSSFNGVSLSTKANSSFFIDGPFDIVEHFKTWAKKNAETLNNIMSEKCYLHLTPSKISLPNKSKYTDIKNIQGLQKTQRFFWIKGKAFVKVLNQPFWYMSCDNCNKVSGANCGDIYQCVYCKYPNSKAAPRAKVYLQLMDSTGYINATAIGEPAESFLLCNANTLMNHSVSNPDSNIIDLIRLATEEEKTFYIKAIQQNEEATEFKYELLFVLGSDSTVTAGNQQSKDKGKSPMVEDEQSQQMDSKDVTPPPAKRSLFQTPETPLPTKKKTEIAETVKRRSEDTCDKDLLQLILGSAKNYGDNGNLPADITPNKFIVDNCKNIYFASHETTAISASWCLMLLASHPEWQARGRAEVLEIYGLRFSTADTLRSLKTHLVALKVQYPRRITILRGIVKAVGYTSMAALLGHTLSPS
ncbi:Replication protein A 70 kDa DNA-binding subunit B [Abeliophyllum distichum]|uniref:Replication protein A 70 kDa DNA-binding subunit B n=1 Tax=Abeliophyllum distichum TaxID=126358 RepID=A0ABD1SFU0_9LAMI